MRTLCSKLRVMVLFAALAGGTAAVAAPPFPPIDRASFYEVLTPYGSWVTVAGYGTVWRPFVDVVGADFYPYFTGGHWEYTIYGWTWASDWPWGWVPFHHGRWLFTLEYGWVWVPDDEWAPAWVDWRIGDGFIGWVPMGPPGVLVVYSFYAPRWCWVRAHHFHRHDLHHHRINDRRTEDDAYHRATPVASVASAPPRGPPPEQVRAQGGQVEPRTAELPRRLAPGAVAAERRIAVSLPVPPPSRPGTPATRPDDRLPRGEITPVPAWKPPPEPAPAQPWRVRPGVPERPVAAPPIIPGPAPGQPLPPPVQAPEAIKKKQQKGVVPAPMLTPGPARKAPKPIP